MSHLVCVFLLVCVSDLARPVTSGSGGQSKQGASHHVTFTTDKKVSRLLLKISLGLSNDCHCLNQQWNETCTQQVVNVKFLVLTWGLQCRVIAVINVKDWATSTPTVISVAHNISGKKQKPNFLLSIVTLQPRAYIHIFNWSIIGSFNFSTSHERGRFYWKSVLINRCFRLFRLNVVVAQPQRRLEVWNDLPEVISY